jgi:hypothetical protein
MHFLPHNKINLLCNLQTRNNPILQGKTIMQALRTGGSRVAHSMAARRNLIAAKLLPMSLGFSLRQCLALIQTNPSNSFLPSLHKTDPANISKMVVTKVRQEIQIGKELCGVWDGRFSTCAPSLPVLSQSPVSVILRATKGTSCRFGWM